MFRQGIKKASVTLLSGMWLAGCTSLGEKKSEPVRLASSDSNGAMMSDRFQAVTKQCTNDLEAAKQLLEQILKAKGTRNLQNTLAPYNELELRLDSATSLAGLLSQVHPEKSVRDEAEACEQETSRFATELSLNRDLYEAFRAVKREGLDADAQRMLDKTLADFVRSGVDKDDATRARIKTLEEELVLIGQDFGRNIREDVRTVKLDAKKDLKGLPADYIAAHRPDSDGKVHISTDYPDYLPFMMYADSTEARKDLWMKFTARGYPANEKVLKDLIAKRHELAQLLGYKSYADYVLEDKMIKSAPRVAEFIEKITDIATKGSEAEYAALLKVKQKLQPKATEVFGYERAYLDEKLKRSKYKHDSQAVRPYFQFEKVRDGLLALTGDLFGIRYVPVRDLPLWHASVSVYDVFDGATKMGRIYLDLHPRENKYKHAAQFTLKSGLIDRQIPEGVLVCNFPDPASSSEPALMDHDDVVTFFHEFGHLLHHIMGGQQKWIRFSGVATEWDFVEAPSQLFEEWAWDPAVLQRFAIHHKTQKPISAELVARMRAADEFGKGLDARQQMFYAALSFNYYHKDPSSFDTHQVLKTLQSKYSKFPYVEGTHFNLNFGHLDDYSAMYYTYMWSKVIAKDLFTPFKKDGMLNTEHAHRYRHLILERGGSKDADELVSDFLGRPYEFQAFRSWLESEQAPKG